MTDAASPAAAPATAPAEPTNAIAAIVAKHQAKEAARAQAETQPAEGMEQPAGDAEPAKEGDAAAAKPKEEQKPEPKTEEKGLTLKHAKLQADHKQLQTKHAETAKAFETTRGELDQLKALGKRNPLKLAEQLTGMTFKQIMETAAKGAYDERSLPPEVAAELEESRKFREEAKKQREEADKQKEWAEELKAAETYVKRFAEAYPFFAAAPWAAEDLAKRAEHAATKRGLSLDSDEVIEQLIGEAEQDAVENLQSMAKNTALMAALAKNDQLRQTFAEALGLAATKNAPRPASRTSGASESGTGSRTLSQKDTQESPVPPDKDAPLTPEQEEAEIQARWAAFKKKGRIAG